MATRSEYRRLLRSYVDALLEKLEEEHLWPRPLGSRVLEMGKDFYYNMVIELPEFQAIEETISDDSVLCPLYGRDGKIYRNRFIWILEKFFTNVVADSRANRVETTVFNHWFSLFYSELHRKTGLWREICTVRGLHVIGRPFILDSSTKLISQNSWDLSDLIQGQELDRQPSGILRAAIISDFKVNKMEHAESDKPYFHQMRDYFKTSALVTALRLLFGGEPIIQDHVSAHLSTFPLSNVLSWEDRETSFSELEISIIPKNHRSIKSLTVFLISNVFYERPYGSLTTNPLAIAISRFNETFRSNGWFNSFVDLSIALETLVGPANSSGELNYRIASRIAWVLGENDAHSELIYRQIRVLYELRSNEVHGNVHSSGKLSSAERKLKQNLAILAGKTYDEHEHWTQVISDAGISARDLVRQLILACIRLQTHASSSSREPKWPLPDGFDSLAWSQRTRRAWQRAAGVHQNRKSI